MIEDIKQRLEKITPGEWIQDDKMPVLGDEYQLIHDGTVKKRGMDAFIGLVGPTDHQRADADFIAHAPADLRWAVAEVERLQQEVDLRQALDVTPKLMQQLSVANATAQTVPPLLERIGQLEADNAQLRAALERYERCTHYDSRLQETCNHCHACMHITGHAEDCWWAAAMKGKG